MLPAMWSLFVLSYRGRLAPTVTRAAVALVASFLATACSPPSQPPAPQTAEAVAAPSPRAGGPAVVFLGDSLTAGYGLAEEQAFPALLEARMREAGLDLPVVNAGVSGDTTAGGLSRLDWIFRQRVGVLVVALGGNDGLRGVPVAETRRNLAQIIERGKSAGARVVLAGMKLPVNYGPQYRRQFEVIYPELAKRYAVPLVPFLLEGVGGVARLNQADGIHPTAEGQRIIADLLWPVLEPVLKDTVQRAEAPGGTTTVN
jgi:acyl-CoA thioesterase-1